MVLGLQLAGIVLMVLGAPSLLIGFALIEQRRRTPPS
jgi:hypothetical protein